VGKDEQPQKVPKEFGKYKVLSKLGQGGMSAVYLAEDSILGRKVALKVLPPSIADESFVKRFYYEARMTAKLNHPNIVTLHDVGEEKGVLYVAMEYVEGPDLAELIKGEEQLPILVLLRIMAAMAGALQHAHDNQVIHRDIKPENVIVGPTGEPVFIDFGLAVPPSGDPLTPEGMFVGSPYYASPEQAKGKDVSFESDIWSFGATMYHLIAGGPPYEAKTALGILKKTASPDPVDLSPLENKAPEYVVNIVGKCLRKDPGERYRAAEELRRALEAAIDHIEMSESDTIDMPPPREGQTLLLHVEYQEADLPGAYREYEMGPRIGGGTYGDVFRVKEKISGKTAAMKVLKREWVSDADAVARFRREAMLLSRLSHQNIVRVHNFGRYGASFFMAMDLLGEKTLEDVMVERGRMDVKEALSLIGPVLSGLDAVHRAGAMHRDLKPSNIAVAGEKVVIFDFGMARSRDMRKLTLSGVILGSPAYMAPEQASGDSATSASDVYAAGVITYEMLSGKLPHEGESTYKLLQRIASEPPVPIAERLVGVPEAVAGALERILAKDPAGRPGASEARELLAAAADR
jgi:serine/threonine-protein kinase